MSKGKLAKFADMETYENVFQYPFSVVSDVPFTMRGSWHEEYFKNENPIVLELGCGKGEYAVGLAQRFPGKNYIGVDIKGARMWTGAKLATELGLPNVAFLRTSIELIDCMFAPNEVSEIWITFPDPQMKKVNKRLTSTRFLDNYRNILCDGGLVHLKTDSPFLYTYTHALVEENHLPVEADTDDLYASGLADDILDIKTHYEMQWLQRGLTIKYIRFALPHGVELVEPDIEIEPDTYRSYNRGYIQMPQLMQEEENNN
jgi:tRNA (guanine-N7-)-methyltransferase